MEILGGVINTPPKILGVCKIISRYDINCFLLWLRLLLWGWGQMHNKKNIIKALFKYSIFEILFLCYLSVWVKNVCLKLRCMYLDSTKINICIICFVS